MNDRETIMTWLEKCDNGGCSLRCPYDDLGPDKCYITLMTEVTALLKEQETEIRQLRLALDIIKGTCKGIVMEGR